MLLFQNFMETEWKKDSCLSRIFELKYTFYLSMFFKNKILTDVFAFPYRP